MVRDTHVTRYMLSLAQKHRDSGIVKVFNKGPLIRNIELMVIVTL